MYGRDYRNQRVSPLAQTTPENVKELRPVRASGAGASSPARKRRR
jgi:glucose dehydrogenase